MRTALAMICMTLGLAGLGCGGSAKTPATPADRPSRASTSDTTKAASDAPVTEADCRKLIAHAIELSARENPATAPPDATSRAEVKAQLEAALMPSCLEELSRAQLECALAATTSAAWRACDA